MIYIHVPFCRSFCTYCDFYSEIVGKTAGCAAVGAGKTACAAGLSDEVFERYTDDLCAEIRARQDEILAASGVRTLYIGGGTPSVLPLECLRRIVEKLREVEATALAGGASAGDWEEFTIEVNPEDIVERGPEYVRGLMELGVNRISMGVQSLDDGMLRWMNRRHSADGAREAWSIISDATGHFRNETHNSIPLSLRPNPPQGALQGTSRRKHPGPNADSLRPDPPQEAFIKDFTAKSAENRNADGYPKAAISIDLISGVPGMDCAMLGRTLNEVLEWRPEHISAYQLSVEEGSALARMIADGRVAELPDEECRAQYELVCQKLGAAGYHHYEISNWALPRHEAVHNSAYWTRQPYVGLGPGAHSLEITPSRQIRKWNSRRPTGWAEEGREVLTEEEIREETVMLLARTDRGPIPERDWFVADELIADLL